MNEIFYFTAWDEYYHSFIHHYDYHLASAKKDNLYIKIFQIYIKKEKKMYIYI